MVTYSDGTTIWVTDKNNNFSGNEVHVYSPRYRNINDGPDLTEFDESFTGMYNNTGTTIWVVADPTVTVYSYKVGDGDDQSA